MSQSAVSTKASRTMTGVVLPGNSTVEFREQPVPEPGYRQVLVEMKASSICGSDIRAIYREHLGTGDEAYRNVIAGHEPDRKSTRLNSSHLGISYAVFC